MKTYGTKKILADAKQPNDKKAQMFVVVQVENDKIFLNPDVLMEIFSPFDLMELIAHIALWPNDAFHIDQDKITTFQQELIKTMKTRACVRCRIKGEDTAIRECAVCDVPLCQDCFLATECDNNHE